MIFIPTKKESVITRIGKSLKEVRSKWNWENPDTVINRIRYNGKTSSGKKEYMIFFSKRINPSKITKKINELKSKGAEWGKPTLRRKK